MTIAGELDEPLACIGGELRDGVALPIEQRERVIGAAGEQAVTDFAREIDNGELANGRVGRHHRVRAAATLAIERLDDDAARVIDNRDAKAISIARDRGGARGRQIDHDRLDAAVERGPPSAAARRRR